jgi:signal transduction histidine kinase
MGIPTDERMDVVSERAPPPAAEAEVAAPRDVRDAAATDRLQADFVATVAHELRTPLTPLKGFLATLLAGDAEDDPEARREYYRIMQKQVARLELLIADLLEVSRIGGGELHVDSRRLDLTAVVREQIADFTRYQPDRPIRLQAPAGPLFVRADPFRVAQVVSNLVSNALKYSDHTAPVEVAVVRSGAEAVVSVRDQGEGIPAAEQRRVFERFHRVESDMTRRSGGTGLGLYIARSLVEAMRGRLWVVSSPGDGSTFSFTLPADPSAPD